MGALPQCGIRCRDLLECSAVSLWSSAVTFPLNRMVLMRKNLIFVALFLILILCSCSGNEEMLPVYEFVHPMDEIVSIELLYNGNTNGSGTDESKFRLLNSLSEDDMTLFMNEVYQLETSYCINPPPRGYGLYIARVTYSNGDVEMLGTRHIEFIPSGAEPTGVGAYYFAGDAIDKLILQYVNSSDAA